MTTYYLPIDEGGYPIGDEAYETDAQAYEVVKDYMGENRIHEAMYNHGCVEEIEITFKPIMEKYECVSLHYPDDEKSRGKTHAEAIENYIKLRM